MKKVAAADETTLLPTAVPVASAVPGEGSLVSCLSKGKKKKDRQVNFYNVDEVAYFNDSPVSPTIGGFYMYPSLSVLCVFMSLLLCFFVSYVS